MKYLFAIMILVLSGCASQGDANLMKGELYVSGEHNRVKHKIRLNPKKLYSFKINFGHKSNTIKPQDDETP